MQSEVLCVVRCMLRRVFAGGRPAEEGAVSFSMFCMTRVCAEVVLCYWQAGQEGPV